MEFIRKFALATAGCESLYTLPQVLEAIRCCASWLDVLKFLKDPSVAGASIDEENGEQVPPVSTSKQIRSTRIRIPTLQPYEVCHGTLDEWLPSTADLSDSITRALVDEETGEWVPPFSKFSIREPRALVAGDEPPISIYDQLHRLELHEVCHGTLDDWFSTTDEDSTPMIVAGLAVDLNRKFITYEPRTQNAMREHTLTPLTWMDERWPIRTPEEENLVCDGCGWKFNNFAQLEDHLESTEYKAGKCANNVCEKCGKRFPHYTGVHGHRRTQAYREDRCHARNRRS